MTSTLPPARQGSSGRSGKVDAVQRVLRVAFDVTPMIGTRTGVGNLVAGFRQALDTISDLELVGYATTVRGRRQVRRELGAGVAPVPARVLRQAWLRADWPPVEMWVPRVDMVHGMNYVVPPTRTGRSLVSVHDLTVVRYPEMCTSDTLQYPELLRRAFRRGAHVHVDSRYVGEELAAWSGLDREHIHVVHPGLDPLRPPTPTDNVTATVTGILEGPPFILAVGTIEPRKDYTTLLRAFAELSAGDAELHLVVAGAPGWGSSAFSDELQRLPSPLRQRIRQIGYVGAPDKHRLLAKARVLAYPSIYEGFGLPPLEAMQHRTPVVSTNAGSLPEVLGDAALFVDVGDVAGLAEALRSAHVDEEVRAGLQTKGVAQCDLYTWERAAPEMFAVYRRIVGMAAS